MQDKQARQERLETLRREIGAYDARAFTVRGAALNSDRDLQTLEPLFHAGFHECAGQGPGDQAAALGFALACASLAYAATGKPVLYAALSGERQETGRLYAPGLTAHGLGPHDLLCITAASEKDLYWVAEESLETSALAAIVLHPGSWEKLYDFTISRRLKLRVERASMPLFLVRPWQSEGATAATARWRVSRLPSAPDPLIVPRQPLIGRPRFGLRPERGPAFHHQTWEFAYDASGRFHLVAPLADGPTAERSQSRAA